VTLIFLARRYGDLGHVPGCLIVRRGLVVHGSLDHDDLLTLAEVL
jgi:hypothetical protein